jgi:ABC-type transport system involved in cytochrome c biogenesis permease subunit
MIRRVWLCLTLVMVAVPCEAQAEAEVRDSALLAAIPILHEGRIKPLDTFARTQLLAVYGRRSLPDMSAMEWLIELLFDHERAYDRAVFTFRNPDVAAALSIPVRTGHHYSFQEISQAMEGVLETVMALHQRPKEERSATQQQLVDVYVAMLRYYEISRTFAYATVRVDRPVSSVAKRLQLPADQTEFSYRELTRYRARVLEAITPLKDRPAPQWTPTEQALFAFAQQMQALEQEVQTHSFRIVAPQWEAAGEEWLSPWAVGQAGGGSPASASYIAAWERLAAAYRAGNAIDWPNAVAQVVALGDAATARHLHGQHIDLEVFYNRTDFLTKSCMAYVLAFLLLAASWLGWRLPLVRLACGAAGVGMLLHTGGILLRIWIMGRPPVSTLYESIIFVAWVAVVFGLLLEWSRRNGLGLLIAALMGAALHFIGFGYADDGDTMGQLVAVLNTNFWLATHVVTITIGYGCAFVGGVVGHVYLIKRLRYAESHPDMQSLARNMVGVSLFALFFALFGTILGGIWADQSWGRFWGWDPKENGALLIVLWLLWLLHGRLAGIMQPLGYALGMVITNIIVALAWFGVNLLNVGLHSYGFTDSIALNLGLFCGGELLLGFGIYTLVRTGVGTRRSVGA